ncbi:hypothetical protein ACFSTC_47735 [Nonomuraea ferruginea]
MLPVLQTSEPARSATTARALAPRPGARFHAAGHRVRARAAVRGGRRPGLRRGQRGLRVLPRAVRQQPRAADVRLPVRLLAGSAPEQPDQARRRLGDGPQAAAPPGVVADRDRVRARGAAGADRHPGAVRAGGRGADRDAPAWGQGAAVDGGDAHGARHGRGRVRHVGGADARALHLLPRHHRRRGAGLRRAVRHQDG